MMIMKRFMVFTGDDYYPKGGMEDFDCGFQDKKKAIDYAKKQTSDWCHVWDIHTNKRVYSKGY